MNSCNVRSRVISTKIWFNSSPIFGMCGLRLMQLSFSFRESSAIFTDLSFVTVITTGDTKQYSSTLFTFSRCPAFISFSSSRPTLLVGVTGSVLLCVSPVNVQVSVVYFLRYLLLSGCKKNYSGNLVNTLSFSDWWFRPKMLNKSVMSGLSVISISIFCLLFSYSMFTGIFPRNF